MRLENVLLFLISLILVIFLFEGIIYFTGLDVLLIEPILAYQSRDDVSMVLDDSDRLYGLKPGFDKVSLNGVHPLEDYGKRHVTINSLGFRGSERLEEKPKDVTRIIVFGGSNTYGDSVTNEDTYPALLDEDLNARFHGKFEVWNAGIPAYVTSQKVAYAEDVVEKFNPDIVVFQIYNLGRRHFFKSAFDEEFNSMHFKSLFRENSELYLENIILPFVRSSFTYKIHEWFVVNSAFYRLIMINLDRIILSKCDYGDSCMQMFNLRNNPNADSFSIKKAQEFIEANPDLDIIFLINPVIHFDGTKYCVSDYNSETLIEPYVHVSSFFLCPEGRSDEFFDIHPPSYVYDWYVEEIVGFLIEEEYI